MKKKYLYLSDLFEQIGTCRFEGEWAGTESKTPHIVSYDDILTLQKRLTKQAAKLRLRDDREYVRQAAHENDHTGHLDICGDSERRNFIYELEGFYWYIDEYQLFEDPIAYRDLYKKSQRKTAVLSELRDLLAQEVLQAYGADKNGRAAVPSEVWGARRVEFDIMGNSALVGSRSIEGLHFEAHQVVTLLRTTVRQTASAESRAFHLLFEMMSAPDAERRARAEVFDELKKNISGLAERAFNRAWRLACDRTQSGWGKAGRPRISVEQRTRKSPRRNRRAT